MKKTIIIPLSLFLISIFAYVLLDKEFSETSVKKSDKNNTDRTDLNENIDKQAKNNNNLKRYDENPSYQNPNYFEKFEIIEEQQTYIAFPIEINIKNPPQLIIYSHGSNTNVTTDLENTFMKDLQYYGEFFATKGYGFAASNQHGMNYGSQESINDTKKLIDLIAQNYNIQPKVHMIGFSMGGLPAIYYAVQYPEEVRSLALLAPVTYVWGSSIYTPIKNVDIKIWHGDKDVNVGYSASTGFIQRGKPFGINAQLRTIEGAGHFDIDTEMIEEIYQFFESIE